MQDPRIYLKNEAKILLKLEIFLNYARNFDFQKPLSMIIKVIFVFSRKDSIKLKGSNKYLCIEAKLCEFG